jgi:glycosyltransferase 2 family protein
MTNPSPDKQTHSEQFSWKIPRKGRRVIAILLTLLAIAILGRMIYTNWNSLQSFEWKVRPIPLAGSFLAYIIYIGLAAFSWGSILNSLGSTSSWVQHFRIYYISTLANRLPVPFGNIAGRFILYNVSTTKKMISFASGLELLLVAMAGITLGGIFRPKSISYFNWWVFLPVILVGLMIVHPRVLKPLLSFLKLHGPIELQYWHTIKWLLSYLLVWITGGVALYLLIISFFPLTFFDLPNIIGVWCLSGLAGILTVFLPVGMGLHEVVLSLLLSGFLPPAISAVIAILSRIIFTLFEIVLAGIASFLKD